MKTRTIGLRIDKSLEDILAFLAKEDGTTITTFIRKTIICSLQDRLEGMFKKELTLLIIGNASKEEVKQLGKKYIDMGLSEDIALDVWKKLSASKVQATC